MTDFTRVAGSHLYMFIAGRRRGYNLLYSTEHTDAHMLLTLDLSIIISFRMSTTILELRPRLAPALTEIRIQEGSCYGLEIVTRHYPTFIQSTDVPLLNC